MRRRDVEIIGVHLALFLSGGVLLTSGWLEVVTCGWIFAVAYQVAVPAFAVQRKNNELLSLWLVLIPVSLFQLLPDWFLAAELGVLEFPSDPTGWPVPGFMAGLWTPPLVLVCYARQRAVERRSTAVGYGVAALTGAVMFVGAELALTTAGVWTAVDVTTVAGVALYIIPAEIVLCVGALYMVRRTDDSPWYVRVPAAAALSIFYLGAAATSLLVVEHFALGG